MSENRLQILWMQGVRAWTCAALTRYYQQKYFRLPYPPQSIREIRYRVKPIEFALKRL